MVAIAAKKPINRRMVDTFGVAGGQSESSSPPVPESPHDLTLIRPERPESSAPAPSPWRSRASPAGPSAGSVTFWVATAPSGPTHAHRLATQIDEDVMAMPNAPERAQRATSE